jgi:hypothetical protein
LGLDLVHATSLDFGRPLAWLLHFQKHRPPFLEAEQIWDASQLIRAAVDLHDPPAARFGHPNNGGDDG